MKIERDTPWKFLDDFRGTAFDGEWPTLPELFALSTLRYPDRPCFTVYEPERRSLNYREALAKIEGVRPQAPLPRHRTGETRSP